jgi:hypothetical protein
MSATNPIVLSMNEVREAIEIETQRVGCDGNEHLSFDLSDALIYVVHAVATRRRLPSSDGRSRELRS